MKYKNCPHFKIKSTLIPVSTLEAVGNLVKATTGQRRLSADEVQRLRQDRRDRMMAQKERQRLQREQHQQQRFKQQQTKRTFKLNQKDPFGLNALSVLVSNHGIVGGIQGAFGGHGGHGGHGSHGGHGDHGNTFSGIQGGQGVMNNHQNTYEVHENVEEDTNYQWHGITAGFGTYSGSRPTNTQITIQNKIAPKDESPYKYHYDRTRLQQKIRPNVADKLGYEEDPPIQNKIAPRSGRISFQD
ncbi:PREDICTED: uncharacterized protein LOC108579679 [Habropoda laboriosa]|uniref:uncharacterized protein LOC108579679 n=1 Tax=Habropoda laboriosa TaxID=597456 RepID=UPI00083CED35|nr:PREDICTED: uncharacterized protein LOC108579679 [Habropoda laboriosa]